MIQAAMAQTPLPTAAQRQNQKSGKALQKIDEIGQRGSYHFTDHYLDMIQQVGVICEDLFEPVYDGTRTIGARKGNDEAYSVTINDPTDPESKTFTGDHLVTVSTGPSFDSQRDEASDFADTLAGMGPQMFAVLGPLIVKLKNLGPIGDEMVELLKTLQPPEVRALDAKKQDGKPPDPQQLQRDLVAAEAQIKKLEQVAGEMDKAIKTDQAKAQAGMQEAQFKAQADVQKAQLQAQTQQQLAMLNAKLQADLAQIQAEIEQKKQLAETDRQLALQVMKNSTTIAVAHLAAAAKGLSLDAHAEEEAQALGHEADQNEMDRQHEAVLTMATMPAADETETAEPEA
jgi:hypothetical protein